MPTCYPAFSWGAQITVHIFQVFNRCKFPLYQVPIPGHECNFFSFLILNLRGASKSQNSGIYLSKCAIAQEKCQRVVMNALSSCSQMTPFPPHKSSSGVEIRLYTENKLVQSKKKD